MNKTPFCPACVVDFIDRNGIDPLADEIFVLNNTDMQDAQDAKFELCSAHTHRKLSTQLANARTLTKPRYDEIMAIKLEERNPFPSQTKPKTNPNIKLVN